MAQYNIYQTHPKNAMRIIYSTALIAAVQAGKLRFDVNAYEDNYFGGPSEEESFYAYAAPEVVEHFKGDGHNHEHYMSDGHDHGHFVDDGHASHAEEVTALYDDIPADEPAYHEPVVAYHEPVVAYHEPVVAYHEPVVHYEPDEPAYHEPVVDHYEEPAYVEPVHYSEETYGSVPHGDYWSEVNDVNVWNEIWDQHEYENRIHTEAQLMVALEGMRESLVMLDEDIDWI